MKHFFFFLLTAMAIIAGIAGNVSKSDHWKAAVFFWCVCGVLTILAVVVGWFESLPKPRIVIVGVGSIGNDAGLLIENEGEPAYNITPPDPIQLSGATVVFGDPIIPHFTNKHGQKCFPIGVQTSLGTRSGVSSLFQDMALRGINEFAFEFCYADGKKPSVARYRTIGKMQLVHGNVVAKFTGWKFDWLFLFRGRK